MTDVAKCMKCGRGDTERRVPTDRPDFMWIWMDSKKTLCSECANVTIRIGGPMSPLSVIMRRVKHRVIQHGGNG